MLTGSVGLCLKQAQKRSESLAHATESINSVFLSFISFQSITFLRIDFVGTKTLCAH